MKNIYLKLIIFIQLSVFSIFATAATEQANMGTMAVNVSKSLIQVIQLAFNVSYFMGAVLFISGLFYFHKNGQQPNQGHMKTGIITLFVGAALLALPTIIETAIVTAFVEGDLNSGADL